MRMKLAALALAMSAFPVVASAQREYSETTVVVESYVRTKPGMFNQYMSWLKNTWRPLQEARKKAGTISDYSIQLTTDQRQANDYNLVLVTIFPNMASFDGQAEREEPIMARLGNLAQRDQSSASRESIREIVGSRMFRTVSLK